MTAFAKYLNPLALKLDAKSLKDKILSLVKRRHFQDNQMYMHTFIEKITAV